MMSKLSANSETSLWILGAGGHAKVVADIIRALHFQLVGMIDQRAEMLSVEVEPGGARVHMLQPHFLDELAATGKLPRGASGAVVAIGHNAIRLQLSLALGEALCEALIDPRAIVSPSASIGAGTTILPGVVINAAARIGKAVIINSSATIEHDCVIKDGVHVSPGATLCGNVTVNKLAWVGAGATIIPGVTVGEGAIVGAGSTVIRDVPPHTTVVGVPARERRE